MKTFLFFLAVLTVFLSGCSGLAGDASKTLKIDSERIKSYLNDPGALVTSRQYSQQEISDDFENLNSLCNGTLEKKPYLVFEAKSGDVDLKIFLDEEKSLVVCTIRNEKQTVLDTCQSDADCDDAFLSTVDKCAGTPKSCKNERTTECKGNDNFCPTGCLNSTDSDCLRECSADSQCDDSDSATKDSCGGIIQKCINEPIILGGVQAIACSLDEECVSENICKAGFCTQEGICSFENQPEGTFCQRLKACFEGECDDVKDHLLYIKNFEIKWLGNDSAEIIWSTPYLTLGDVQYGVFSARANAKVASVPKPSLEHSMTIEDLSKGLQYFYQIIAFDPQEINNAKTPDTLFKTCLSNCSDSDKCTIDSCDLETGTCTNVPDLEKAGC